jgi:hypothetical protein
MTDGLAAERTIPPAPAYRSLPGGEGTLPIDAAYQSIPPADPATADDEPYKIGDRIDGRYEVVVIHRGSMGVVYGTFDH